jgi:hypothetical protein
MGRRLLRRLRRESVGSRNRCSRLEAAKCIGFIRSMHGCRRMIEANLRWRTPEEGGRQSPRADPKHSTVARFESQKESWLKEAWSLVILTGVIPVSATKGALGRR